MSLEISETKMDGSILNMTMAKPFHAELTRVANDRGCEKTALCIAASVRKHMSFAVSERVISYVPTHKEQHHQ